MKSRPASMSGRRGSTTTTSGAEVAASEAPRRRGTAAPTTTQRPPMRDQAGQALATRSSGSTRRTRSVAGAGRTGSPPKCRLADRPAASDEVLDPPTSFRRRRRRGDPHGSTRRCRGRGRDRTLEAVRRSSPPGPASPPARGGPSAHAARIEAAGRRRRSRSTTQPVLAAEVEPDLPGAGVLDDVVERLLRDPVEDLLDLERQPLVDLAVDHDRQADPALQRRAVGAQRVNQPVRPRGCRAGARRSAPASPPVPRAGARAASPAGRARPPGRGRAAAPWFGS